MKSNHFNDGRAFQADIETTLNAYRARGRADLRKVDPPSRLVGTGSQRRVIFMANPFLDYVGAWTERHGRTVIIEAKSTQEHRLRLARDGGLTAEQCNTLARWRKAGAAAAVLWRHRGHVTLWTAERVWLEIGYGKASLVHEEGVPVLQGGGTLLVDFLPVLAAQLWPVPPVTA